MHESKKMLFSIVANRNFEYTCNSQLYNNLQKLKVKKRKVRWKSGSFYAAHFNYTAVTENLLQHESELNRGDDGGF